MNLIQNIVEAAIVAAAKQHIQTLMRLMERFPLGPQCCYELDMALDVIVQYAGTK